MRMGAIALGAVLLLPGGPALGQHLRTNCPGCAEHRRDKAGDSLSGREAFDAGGARLAVSAAFSPSAPESARELLAIYLLVSAQARRASPS